MIVTTAGDAAGWGQAMVTSVDKLQSGVQVSHPNHGAGTLELTDGAYPFLVNFDDSEAHSCTYQLAQLLCPWKCPCSEFFLLRR